MANYDNTRQTLLLRMRDKHDENSWEEFHAIYRPYIAAVILKLGIEQADVDDILQKVLLTLWEKLPEFQYDESKRFRSWLAVVTRHACMNFIRSKKAYKSRVEKSAGLDGEAAITLAEVEQIAEFQWKLYISNMAMEKVASFFSGKAMSVFELSLKGRAIDDIAVELGITVNSANQLKFRVKERLKKEIQRLKSDLE